MKLKVEIEFDEQFVLDILDRKEQLDEINDINKVITTKVFLEVKDKLLKEFVEKCNKLGLPLVPIE